MLVFKKSIGTLIAEALIVSLVIVLIMLIINKLSPSLHPLYSAFITGIIAHLLFEVSGVNMWYSKEYCKVI